MKIATLLDVLNKYSNVITILSVFAAGLWAVLKFREYLKDKRFKTYHQLIDELVNEQRYPDRVIKLDRQIAIVYELRNYPGYFSVSRRILVGLRKDWGETDNRIIEEIDLTLEFISCNWFSRSWRKLFRK